MTDQPMTDERLAEIEGAVWNPAGRTSVHYFDELIVEVRRLRAEVERLRTQLDDLRVIHTAYPGTVLDEGDLNVFIKATMDEKWTQHAAPSSIPWLSIRDWLCELRDYRNALGEAPTSD